jgi:hypothetical protein
MSAAPGTVNLKTEEMDLKLKPEPKDPRHRLAAHPAARQGHVRQAGGRPRHGQAHRARRRHHRAGNPQPAPRHHPLIEEGKGKDSNCGQLIAEATKSAKQSAATGASAQKQKEKKPEKKQEKEQAKGTVALVGQHGFSAQPRKLGRAHSPPPQAEVTRRAIHRAWIRRAAGHRPSSRPNG